jgi:hypothetical protein
MSRKNKTYKPDRTGLPLNAAKAAQQPVALTQIIQLATDRGYKDITSWKEALQAAENPKEPKRNALYNLYEQLILDGHMRMIRKQLRLYVTSGEFQIYDKAKKIDVELSALFKKKWFKQLCEEAIDSFFFGHSLLQITEADPTLQEIKLVKIPRKNVIPEVGAWKKNEMDNIKDAVDYRNNPAAMQWLIEIGMNDDLGELNPATPYILFKKNAMQCWSEFCERFGMPLAKAKVNARDISAVNRMQNFLVNMGSSSYAIIDQSEEIDFIESAKSDAYMVYDKLIERCNSELSKMILLQVMANDVGANGSRAQAQVHDLKSDDVRSSLRSFIESLVNETILPLLTAHGFKTEGKTGSYLEVTVVDKDTFEQDKWLEENFDVPIEHWGQKYNTPIQGRKVQAAPAVPPVGGKKPEQIVKNFIESPVNSIMKMHAEINELYNNHSGCGHE